MAQSSVRELGAIGVAALDSASVREALLSVATLLPHHTTNEIITIRSTPGGMTLREAWGLRMDDETLHLVRQYVAALIQSVCNHAGAPLPVFDRVALVPHPVHDLAHLRACFGETVEASADRALTLFVPARVADRPLRPLTVDRPAPDPAADRTPLRGDGSLGMSVRIVMRAMLSEDTPKVERIAAAAGLSVRTLQRRLGAEGTTFSRLLDSVRRDLALADFDAGGRSSGAIAAQLGYGQQSSLTRAVRRWTGTLPRTLCRRDRT
ncbi:helix-turn-helix transcriptional regulator [Rhodovulum tesquicola]|nr:helix-turn-helix transcriptional regulator [Rhodovulum tesquicola]